MRRYDAYKDSGVEWIGEIPEGWEIRALKRSVTLLTDKSGDDTLPFVGLEQIESWTGKRLHAENQAVCAGNSLFAPMGTVLFGKLRPYLAKVYLIEADIACSTEFLPLYPNFYIGRYLQYALLADGFIGLADSSSYGTKMPRVNWEQIGTQLLPIPSSDEQEAIANYLDAKTSEIDELVADCEQEIELLQEYRKAVISEAVTKGLDPDAPMKNSGIEWIGEIPVSWDAVRLDRVAVRKSGHTPDKKVADYWDGDIIWISLADSPRLRTNVYISESATMTTEAGIANSSAELLPAGSVLLSRDASVGLTAIAGVQLAVSQHFMAYICGQGLSNKFLRFVFLGMHQEFEKLSMGSTIPTIGLPLVRKFTIPYPPREDQDKIVDYLNHKVSNIDELISANEQMADKLREYRRSLISEAVTGKFKVPGV